MKIPHPPYSNYKWARTIALFFAALLLLISCSTDKHFAFTSQQVLKIIGERPPLDADLATLAPAGLQGATWLNLTAMRKSPLWPTLESILQTHYAGRLLSRDMVLKMIRQADEILAVSGHRTGMTADGFVTLFKGNWDTAEIYRQLSTATGVKEVIVREQPMLRFSNIYIFALTSKTLVVVSENLLESVQLLMLQQEKSLRDDKNFKDLNPREDGASVARYIRGDSKLNVNQMRSLPASYRKFASDARRADAVLVFSDVIQFATIIHMEKKDQADRVKRTIEKDVKNISSNILIAMLGVKSLVKKLHVKAEDNTVSIAMKLNAKDVQKILQLVEPIMQLQKMM